MDEPPNAKGYTRSQCRAGGLSRARTAIRHPNYGIFLPNEMLFDILCPTTYQHGREGGRARAQNAKRNRLGQFTKGD